MKALAHHYLDPNFPKIIILMFNPIADTDLVKHH